MHFLYRKIDFNLLFEKELSVNTPFVYIFRSVIGSQLHFISCVLKNQVCNDCPLRLKCAYSILFENPISKDNTTLKGRNKSASPYIIKADYITSTTVKSVDMSVIFIGSGIEYIPYFLLAVKRAGEQGMYKERVKYTIAEIYENNKKYTIDDGLANLPASQFNIDTDQNTIYEKTLKIDFISPFRYKKQGTYTSDININDIILSSKRRLDVMLEFYCNSNQSDKITFFTDYEYKKNISWVDRSRYSRRQDTSMKIGGIMGSLEVKGSFSPAHMSILKAGELLNIGKNVSFGLGNIKIGEV